MKCSRIHLAGRFVFLLCLAIALLAMPIRGAATTLEAKLVPAIVISGPLNSLQQVQYSTNLSDTNG